MLLIVSAINDNSDLVLMSSMDLVPATFKTEASVDVFPPDGDTDMDHVARRTVAKTGKVTKGYVIIGVKVARKVHCNVGDVIHIFQNY